MAPVAPWWTVCLSCRYRRVRVPTRRPPPSPEWYGKLDGQQVPEHDTKRATQPIFVNLARASECQDRRKTAPSAALKKPRRFPSLAARFFTIFLNGKNRAGLDTEGARSTIKDRLCCAIKPYLPLFNGLSRRYGQTGSKRAS